jgi:hypothetical protein
LFIINPPYPRFANERGMLSKASLPVARADNQLIAKFTRGINYATLYNHIRRIGKV